MNEKTPAILWIDIETTGLLPGHSAILEIAYAATDMNGLYLENLAGQNIVGSHLVDQESFNDEMANFRRTPAHAFVRNMHLTNGLIADLYDDTKEKLTLLSVNRLLEDVIDQAEQVNEAPYFWYLGGSSVHTDRNHLESSGIDLPVSHRHLDVSSIKLMATATGIPFYRPEIEGVGRSHRALDDILEDVYNYSHFVKTLQELRNV